VVTVGVTTAFRALRYLVLASTGTTECRPAPRLGHSRHASARRRPWDGGAPTLDGATDQWLACLDVGAGPDSANAEAQISEDDGAGNPRPIDASALEAAGSWGVEPSDAGYLPNAQSDGQNDISISFAALSVDRSTVDLESQTGAPDGGARRPITVGSVGTAKVVVTNNGSAASGALAIVAGPDVTTAGCTGALAPNASCNLTIRGTPKALGPFSSSVSVWATPGATTPIEIAVTATVVGVPAITSFVAGTTAAGVCGALATLTAVFSNGTGTVDHDIGPVTSGVGVNIGPVDVTTTYTLTVVNEAGDFRTARVTVISAGGARIAVAPVRTPCLRVGTTRPGSRDRRWRRVLTPRRLRPMPVLRPAPSIPAASDIADQGRSRRTALYY
jgi:hypothetical protein